MQKYKYLVLCQTSIKFLLFTATFRSHIISLQMPPLSQFIWNHTCCCAPLPRKTWSSLPDLLLLWSGFQKVGLHVFLLKFTRRKQISTNIGIEKNLFAFFDVALILFLYTYFFNGMKLYPVSAKSTYRIKATFLL